MAAMVLAPAGAALCSGPQLVVCGTVALLALGVGALMVQSADDDAEESLGSEADEGACAECGGKTLPENPDDLREEGWEEEEHRAPNRRRFRNPETGEVIEFDQGQPGQPGWRGRDHYHRPNPNAPGGKSGAYLDRYGNPVNEGSGASHIPPGTTISNGGE